MCIRDRVCAYSPEKLKGLTKYYGFPEDVDAEKLMFAIHTYYTILMKLLTSEIVTLFADSLIGSYLKRLEEAYLRGGEELRRELSELEEGGIFAELGIRNFLEANYFAWYLDEWDDEIASLIVRLVKKLLDYEPATIELTPERIKDLFKRLYQNLVPRDIRHKLGEYFTPDWLAELVLDEVGYDGDPDKRVLDPACGSGTFLVLAINRIKEYAEEHFIDKRALLTKILRNVRGIDLNPLAVLAAKANYLIALADLLRYRPRGGIDIPIYLADSIAVGRRQTLTGLEICLKTGEGEFSIPYEVVEKDLLPRILNDIEFCIKNNYSQATFSEFLRERYGGALSQNSVISLSNLYGKMLGLEKKGKNRIWVRILKNSFAPLLIGKFDYVVGNPPWINWINLPEFYRNETKDLWEQYGLLRGTKGRGMGKVCRDMAMLFIARCLDRFTKEGGKLGFLLPFTVFKTQAGAGFRTFLARGIRRCPCKVLKVHDLVTLYPFEGATNRTALIIIVKEGKTGFPIPYVLWYNSKIGEIGQEVELDEVKKFTRRFNLVFMPVEVNRPESPWMEISMKAYEGLKKALGESPWYKAYKGVYVGLTQVYWVQLLSETEEGFLVTNPPLPGQKRKVRQVKNIVERDLVYPLVKGRDVKRWYISGELGYILLPVDKNGRTYPHSDLKVKYPKTYRYFLNFINELVNVGGEPYKSKLKPYREMPFEKAEKIAPPFYWIFNAAPSIAPYKVVWKRIAGGITGKAVSFASAVLEPAKTDLLKVRKPVIVHESLILIPFNEREEAYYVSAILNSSIALLAIASYTYELRQETHITQYIRIPKFDPNDPLHQRLSQLSQKAHEIAKKIYEENKGELKEDLRKVEEEIDGLVAELYGITEEELKEIRKCLAILREGKVVEE